MNIDWRLILILVSTMAAPKAKLVVEKRRNSK